MRPVINCDMGEGMASDALLMPFIQAANIACGYHAGDVESMAGTISLCLDHQVAIGAHPSFLDREHFGRIEMDLPVQELYELVTQQLFLMQELVSQQGGRLAHVKPHGALYNLSARDPITARVIARAVKDFDPALLLVGLSGSHSITEAKELGLAVMSEAFADRSYQEDGTLTARSEPGALITEVPVMLSQVRKFMETGTVTTMQGTTIQVQADTICIHGDGDHALEFAKAIHEAFHQS